MSSSSQTTQKKTPLNEQIEQRIDQQRKIAARQLQKAIELENKDLKDELEAKLQLKNSKIDALEQTLAAQEQLVENMRQEMDHLQGSMERSTIGRRAEIEDILKRKTLANEATGEKGWEEMLPEGIAEIIIKEGLFGYSEIKFTKSK